MVSNLKIIFMFVTLIISFGIPITLTIILVKRAKGVLKSVLIGACVFFVFQTLLRIPILQSFSKQGWYVDFSKHYIIYSLFLGLTAGIFEEVGRYIGFKLFLKDRLNYLNGVAFGVGHGGIEAILLVGVAYMNNIVYSFLINQGNFDKLITPVINPSLANTIKNELINTPDYAFLLAGIERIFAIIIQIALSLLILYAVKRKKPSYLFTAIALHMLIDSPIAYMSIRKVNLFIIEAVVMLFAILAFIFILKVKEIEDDTKATI